MYIVLRYTNRPNRFKGTSEAADETVTPALRSVDLLCFSEQFYFAAFLNVLGSAFFIVGIQGQLRQMDRFLGSLNIRGQIFNLYCHMSMMDFRCNSSLKFIQDILAIKLLLFISKKSLFNEINILLMKIYDRKFEVEKN